jgi:hypothetical protein
MDVAPASHPKLQITDGSGKTADRRNFEMGPNILRMIVLKFGTTVNVDLCVAI